MLATRARVGLLIGLATIGAVSTAIAVRPDKSSAHALTADAILEASATAQGGRARLRAVRDTHVISDLRYANGEKALETLDIVGPRLRMLVVWPEFNVDYVLDVDKTTGKVIIDQGAIGGDRDRIEVTGPERIQMLVDSSFGKDEWFAGSELAGTVVFAGEPAYKIVRTLKAGETRTLYISQLTFLPIGSERDVTRDETRWKTQDSRVERYTTTFSDYRNVSGLLIPFASQQVSASGTVDSQIVSYQITF